MEEFEEEMMELIDKMSRPALLDLYCHQVEEDSGQDGGGGEDDGKKVGGGAEEEGEYDGEEDQHGGAAHWVERDEEQLWTDGDWWVKWQGFVRWPGGGWSS